ncbi:MAG TPA: hypothetical protein VF108_02975 [Actinomycetota bacterium]
MSAVPPRRIDLDALLRSHAFMRVERPPELWEVEVLDGPFIRMLGELIVVGLLHHHVLAELTLNVNNVTSEEPPDGVAPGEFLAVTIRGPGDWHDAAWTPASTEPLWSPDLDAAIRGAQVVFAYARRLADDEGSITVWIPRSGPDPKPGAGSLA